MKKRLVVLGLVAVGLLATACGKPVQEAKVTPQTESHLNYEEQADWQLVSGKMQSPVDIVTSSVIAMTETGVVDLAYSPVISEIENNGHSLQVTGTGEAVLNQREFALTQFHFHAQSEHTVDGKHSPMEVHFVHQAQDGRLAVVAVFIEEGEENQGFAEVLANYSQKTTDNLDHLNDLLPVDKGAYHYLGSLTTPPLTENVEWYVMKAPVYVSASQINSFTALYEHNNRDTQPLNERVILETSN